MTLTLLHPRQRRTKRMLRDVPVLTPELLADVRQKAERALTNGHTVNITAHVAIALLRALDADIPAPDEPRQSRLF